MVSMHKMVDKIMEHRYFWSAVCFVFSAIFFYYAWEVCINYSLIAGSVLSFPGFIALFKAVFLLMAKK